MQARWQLCEKYIRQKYISLVIIPWTYLFLKFSSRDPARSEPASLFPGAPLERVTEAVCVIQIQAGAGKGDSIDPVSE